MRKRNTLTNYLGFAMLVILSTIFTLPFYWLVTSSFKTNENLNKFPPQMWPIPSTTEHYALSLIGNAAKGIVPLPWGLFLLNTVLICALNVAGVLISSSLVAYGLSRIQWKGSNVLFWILISTMMLPAQVTMIPMFAMFTKFGWVDTFLPLVVPAFTGSAFCIFLLRQFYLTVPQAITEAARLDGCNEFQIYRRIMLPLAVPAMATVGLFTFIGSWNDFLGPLIYLFDESRYTLSLGLQMFLSQYGNFFGRLMAMSTLMVIPIILLFFFAQKTFIQGITMGGVKE
ncbi:MAG: carbohydrate ABC transporter permease [Armatimonadota bacterium]